MCQARKQSRMTPSSACLKSVYSSLLANGAWPQTLSCSGVVPFFFSARQCFPPCRGNVLA